MQGRGGKRMNRKYRILSLICVFSIALLALLLHLHETLSDGVLWKHQYLHKTQSAISGAIMMEVSYLLFVFRTKWTYNLSGFIIGMMMMGAYSITQAIIPPGEFAGVLLTLASFSGAGALLSIGMNQRFGITMEVKQWHMSVTFITGIILSAFFYIWTRSADFMQDSEGLQALLSIFNTLNAVMYLLAALFFFYRIWRKDGNIVELLFLFSSVILGESTFELRHIEHWSIPWWVWYLLRFSAFIMFMVFVIMNLNDNRKKLERQNREIQNINKKLNDYSYIISHDLKEPIRSIRTFSEFIKEDYEETLDETGKDYFDRIIIASSRMAQMIDDLLTLSRIGRENIEFRNVPLKEIIDDVLIDLDGKIRETDARITCHDLPVIHCQPVWIHNVFQNLIGNALKYRDTDKNEHTIDITSEIDKSDPSFYCISVTDNGIGIDSSQHEKIFGLFRRAYSKKDKEGSGAGLAIVQSIIEEHGGTIRVAKSVPGEGTSITFTLKKELNHAECDYDR